jgi:hypothetical protein
VWIGRRIGRRYQAAWPVAAAALLVLATASPVPGCPDRTGAADAAGHAPASVALDAADGRRVRLRLAEPVEAGHVVEIRLWHAGLDPSDALTTRATLTLLTPPEGDEDCPPPGRVALGIASFMGVPNQGTIVRRVPVDRLPAAARAALAAGQAAVLVEVHGPRTTGTVSVAVRISGP